MPPRTRSAGDNTHQLSPLPAKSPGFGLQFDAPDEEQRTRFYRSKCSGEKEEYTWGTYDRPREIQFTAKQVFSLDIWFLRYCQKKYVDYGLEFISPLKLLFPYAFMKFHNKDGKRDFACRDVTDSGVVNGPQLEAAMDFVIYKGMDVESFRSVLKAKFWQFTTGPTWPNHIIERIDGKDGRIIPFEMVSTHPEVFTTQAFPLATGSQDAHTAKLDDHYHAATGTAKTDYVVMAPLSDVFFWSLPLKFARFQKNNWLTWATSMCNTWTGAIIFFVLLAELIGFTSWLLGLDQVWSNLVIVRLSDYLSYGPMARATATVLFATPLRDVYRHGPSFTTAAGEIGFWGGRPLSSVCATITSLKAEYWTEHIKECEVIYQEKEDAFISFCAFATIMFLLYITIKSILSQVKKI